MSDVDWSKFIKKDVGQQVIGLLIEHNERTQQTNALLAALLDATNFRNANSEDHGKESKSKKRK